MRAGTQITTALFTVLFFFSAYIWGHPYRSTFPNLLQAYAQFVLFCTLYCKCAGRLARRAMQRCHGELRG